MLTSGSASSVTAWHTAQPDYFVSVYQTAAVSMVCAVPAGGAGAREWAHALTDNRIADTVCGAADGTNR